MIDDAALDALLTCNLPIDRKVLILVAHPDDEVLGLSVLLPRLTGGMIVHATDGATPGSSDPEALSNTRFSELDEALQLLGAKTLARARLHFPDGALIEHAAAATDRMTHLLRGVELAITHCYEGGHPDHDACALILEVACQRIAKEGRPEPRRMEFPLYARHGSGIRFNAFRPGGEQGRIFLLGPDQQRSKTRALRAFLTQREVVGQFPMVMESLRLASQYDFLSSRRSEEVLYAQQACCWQAAASRFFRRTSVGNGCTPSLERAPDTP